MNEVFVRRYLIDLLGDQPANSMHPIRPVDPISRPSRAILAFRFPVRRINPGKGQPYCEDTKMARGGRVGYCPRVR
jgi:hypothetical protein